MGGNSESGLYSLILSSINPRDGGAIVASENADLSGLDQSPRWGGNSQTFRNNPVAEKINPRDGGAIDEKRR